MHNKINKSYNPYEVCVGRVYRRLPKLYRPFSILLESNLCNDAIIDKNKIRLLKQLFRWFYKSRWGFRIDYKMEMDNIINNGDIIYLYSRIKKAGFRKLLLRCDYELMDYKILKNRKYGIYFTFLFLNIENISDKNISLEIKSKNEDIFNILIIVGGYYLKDFYNLLLFKQQQKSKYLYQKSELQEMTDEDFVIYCFKKKFNY
jgi:hypothetical protein